MTDFLSRFPHQRPAPGRWKRLWARQEFRIVLLGAPLCISVAVYVALRTDARGAIYGTTTIHAPTTTRLVKEQPTWTSAPTTNATKPKNSSQAGGATATSISTHRAKPATTTTPPYKPPARPTTTGTPPTQTAASPATSTTQTPTTDDPSSTTNPSSTDPTEPPTSEAP